MRPKTLCLLPALLAATLACGQITLSSIDTFATNAEGWVTGQPSTYPTQNAGLSHDGVSGYLFHDSDSVSSGGKWLTWNTSSDWIGDYISAGVTSVSFWANNQSGADRFFWIEFTGPGGSFLSSAFTLPGDGNWASYTLDLSSTSYFAGSGGTQVWADTFGAVSRISMSADDADALTYESGGPMIVKPTTSTTTIFIDDLMAVPEPSLLGLVLGLSTLGWVLLRRPRR